MSITQDALVASVECGRIPHALLITGERGAGKRDTARKCARMLLCTKSPKPCGACPGCRLTAAGTHPDLLIVEAQKGTIRIDAVRKMMGELSKKPYGDAYRVVLIENAQQMSVQAQNCLLRTLEEPPQNVVFILTCTSERDLLHTIVSRCQPVRIIGEPRAVLQERLMREHGIDAPAAALCARLGCGHYGRALEWSKRDGPMALYEELWSMLAALGQKGADPLNGYALFKEHSEDMEQALSMLALILGELLLVKQGAKPQYPGHAQQAKALARKFSGPGLQKGLDSVVRSGKLLERNVHHQMLIEDLLLQLKDALEDTVNGQSDRRAL